VFFEACYEVILLWRSRRKLRRKQLGEIPFYQLTSISECDSTIKKRHIDIQSDDEGRAIFHAYGWSNFGLSAVSIFRTLWKSEVIITGFPTTYFAEQDFCQALHRRNSNKYRNRLDVNKTGETPHDINWSTCNLVWKSLQINTTVRFAFVGTKCLLSFYRNIS